MFNMMITSLLHVIMQTTRVHLWIIFATVLSFLIYLIFTLTFDAKCIHCLAGGESPYQICYRKFRSGNF
jgi:hypothetical protein